jgi:hypothetical protein
MNVSASCIQNHKYVYFIGVHVSTGATAIGYVDHTVVALMMLTATKQWKRSRGSHPHTHSYCLLMILVELSFADERKSQVSTTQI